MIRTTLFIACMFLLAGCAEEGTPVAFDFDEACESAGQSPVYAAKTLQACRAFGEFQSTCGVIGVTDPGEGIGFVTQGGAPQAAAWQISWDELAAHQGLYRYTVAALHAVSPARFKAMPTVSEDFIGTHELVLIAEDRWSGLAVTSLFMKEQGRGWIITSFDDWSVAGISNSSELLRESKCLREDDAFCAMWAVGIAHYAPDKILSETWRPARVYSTAEIANACQTQVGTWRANRYARWCRNVSGGTHPPCNPMNSCEIVAETLAAGCVSLADSVGDYEFALPRYCLWALTKQTTLPSSRSTGD